MFLLYKKVLDKSGPEQRYYDARLARWLSVDPPLISGEYLPTGNKKHDANLPGMGGIFNAVNLNAYHYAGLNPLVLVDPDGNFAIAIPYLVVAGAKAIETGLIIGAGALTGYLAHKAIENSKDGNVVKSEDVEDISSDTDKLPNQGEVDAGVEDAPNVDAGSQGKHVPGHNNDTDPNKSKWNEGENGVKQTQEAWQNGRTVKPDGSVRVGQSSDGRTIKVHQDKKGNIHGYPLK